MPNWVYGSLSVTGDAEEVQAVKKQLARPYKRLIVRYTKDGTERGIKTVEPTFSFWNIVRPEGSDREKYDESLGAAGSSPFWYDWNCENWGTKWDTDAELEEFDEAHLRYRIETAWSPPTAALVALSAQHPDVHFELDWEEEQGFGGTYEFRAGGARETNYYDIPTSHADYVDREKEEQCVCQWSEDPETFFSDCPSAAPAVDPACIIPDNEIEVELIS